MMTPTLSPWSKLGSPPSPAAVEADIMALAARLAHLLDGREGPVAEAALHLVLALVQMGVPLSSPALDAALDRSRVHVEIRKRRPWWRRWWRR